MKTKEWNYFVQMCSTTEVDEEDFMSLLGILKDEPTDKVLSVLTSITPDIARTLLNNGVPNRNIRVASKKRFCDEMDMGNWMMNGQPIILDSRGRLIDGQHRCSAAVSSGVAFKALVVVGVKEDASKTIDTGSKRTNADILRMGGTVNAVSVAATTVIQHRYERGHMMWESSSSDYPTPTQQEDILKRHPGIEESVRFVRGLKLLGSFIQASISAFIHYHASRYDAEKAEVFFSKLASGEGLTSGDVILILRNRLLQDRAGKTHLGNRDIIAITIKAWNSYVAGKKVSVLRWSDTEVFPDFVK